MDRTDYNIVILGGNESLTLGKVICRLAHLNAHANLNSVLVLLLGPQNIGKGFVGGLVKMILTEQIHLNVIRERNDFYALFNRAFNHLVNGIVTVKGMNRVRMHINNIIKTHL